MATVASAAAAVRKMGKVRWLICGLLFLATTVNYVDRYSLSVLKTTLQTILSWSEADYGWIQFGFTTAYAIFPVLAGRMVDALGVKKGLLIGVTLWSFACIAHGFVGAVLGFVLVRFLLGAAESTNFPAANKALAQWFPQSERTLAFGLFNSGTNVGVMISFTVVWLASRFGWPWAFITVGILGLLWIAVWQTLYASPDEHKRVSAGELAYIRAGAAATAETESVHWIKLLRYREVWPILGMKLLTDPVWWFYLFWLPSYLATERGQSPMNSALLMGIIYTGATVGSVVGGLLFGFLMGRGWKVAPARYVTMVIPAAFMPLAIVAYYTNSFALCVALIALATGLHQWWSANVFSVATDVFPARVVGAVTGLATTAGGIGGMLMTLLAGASIQWFGNQQAVFIWAGLMHPLSWIILYVVMGREFKLVALDQPMDLGRPKRSLQLGGLILLGVGLAVVALIGLNWAAAVTAARSTSAVAAAITAAAGVAILGALVYYAGGGHRKLAAQGAK
jgi:ACS family hexuronate transporter-like MFS transporter